MKKPKYLITVTAFVLIAMVGLVALTTKSAHASGTITFEIQQHQLSDGSYGGTVTSNVGGINCTGTSGTCSTSLAYGTTITLTATNTDPTTVFGSWFPTYTSTVCAEGSDTQSTCTLTMPSSGSAYAAGVSWADKHDFSVSMPYNPQTGGKITVNPGNNVCTSSQCSFKYGYGVNMTITATTTSADTVFTGWSGSSGISNCGANTTCNFTSSAGSTGFYASADWDWKAYTVSIEMKGSGKGKVTTSPGGLNCRSNCSGNFDRGTKINFTAQPNSGSVFSGWATAQEGGNLCLLSMGIGDSTYRNTSANCSDSVVDRQSQHTLVLIAYFDTGSGSSSSSSSPSSSSNSSTSTTSSATPTSSDGNSVPAPSDEATVAENQTNSKNAAALGLSNITLGGSDVYSKSSNLTFKPGKTIELRGKAAPNSTIKLFIFSTPREATVKADAQGIWTYTIANLGTGKHHVEAQITDPASNTTSKRMTIANFTIASAVKPASLASKKNGTALYVVIIIVVAVLAAAAVTYVLIRKRKGKMTALVK